MRWIPTEEWSPRGIDQLEPGAWRALRHAGSTSVIAGPGAGKTEFLAQRAVFLLETGLCPPPFRVLAISFKRDAAENLAARVRERCPPELAGRFTSLTFDALTKSLLDRFTTALPPVWRPTRPYRVWFPTWRDTRHVLDVARTSTQNAAWQAEIAGIHPSSFEWATVGAYRLPIDPTRAASGTEYAIRHWWHTQLRGSTGSSVSFVGINRLAELLLRSAPHIARALQVTYPFVFADEFQDTTYAQYDFLLSAFGSSPASVTAVGDTKQRIMTWAGARIDAFDRFESDFQAIRIPLLLNFRSSADLVEVQRVVAAALEPGAPAVIAQTMREVSGEAAQVWTSTTIEREAAHIGRWIAGDMAARGRQPRDYAILVKQKPDDYARDLAGGFITAGLTLRNESHRLGETTLQDLLSDSFSALVVALIRLCASRRAPAAWRLVSDSLMAIRAVSPDDPVAHTKVERELTAFITWGRAHLSGLAVTAENAELVADAAFTFLDLGAIRRTYVEYADGDLLDIMARGVREHLGASAHATQDWSGCLDAYEGVAQVPLMTVHKSKGLEYDTVLFVGLDDSAWWSHTRGDREGLATFFVALSRAKQRAIFCFCQERGVRRNTSDLFALLTAAGVVERSIDLDE